MNRERAQSEVLDGSRERRISRLLPGMLVLALVLGLAALALPALAGPSSLDRLDPRDGAHLAEALRLKQSLGDSVWPGWGQTDIPIIASNTRYAFLIGRSNPPPQWLPIEGDLPDGQAYFRQPAATGPEPVVPLQDGWAASVVLTARRQSLSERLPPAITRFFSSAEHGPQPAVPAEIDIMAGLHASFHAYQAQVAPGHYQAAMQTAARASMYASAMHRMDADWQSEMELLVRALLSDSPQDSADLAREFLAARSQRRESAGLDATQVDYERHIEWLDGLPEYVELNAWRHAYIASDYQPLPALATDASFGGYQGFDAHWTAQLAAMEQPAGLDAPARLASSGMAQAILLDILGVDWKSQLLSDNSNVALEDVLAQALASP